MGYDYGDYDDGGWKSKLSYHMESVVPLILILIVGLLVAVQLGIIDIGGLGGGSNVNVLVIGNPDAATMKVLQSDEASSMGIIAGSPIDPNDVYPETLANYDIILLEGNQYMSRTAREAIKQFVERGGSLILVKNAATKVPESPETGDWSYVFGDMMPVKCRSSALTSSNCPNLISVQAQFIPLNIQHPILQGATKYPEKGTKTFQVVDIIANGGERVAYLKTPEGNTYPAIIIKTNFPNGKIVYFNYDPGELSGIFLNTLAWLK